MKIERIDVFHVDMPVIYPFRTAFGDTHCVESLLVRMRSEGLEGWGESAPWSPPGYSGEYTGGAFSVVCEFLAPRLLGTDIASGRQLQDILRPVKDNFFAKAALDLAWWDLHAQSRNEPLWKAIGGRGPVVDVGADIGVMETVPQLLAEIEKAAGAGFKRIKLKYRPGWELEMISKVREAFPSMVFHVDCNGAYSLSDLPMFRELDHFGLAMIEQPLAHDDLIDHAELRRQMRTPICLDESITTAARVKQAARIGACDWVNIKHGRVGGLTNALAIHDLCRASGIKNWIGGMLESSVGQAFSIALASLGNVKYPSDIFPSSRFYSQDLGEPELALHAPSQVSALDRPGIGFKPNPKRLKELTRRQASFE